MLIYTCNILIYVDDCLLCTPSDQVLDMIIEHLRQKFNITTENYLETYLGIKVQQWDDGTINNLHSWKMNQDNITGHVIRSSAYSITQLIQTRHKLFHTPVHSTRKHEISICCIIWYLRGTKDKGYILKPSTNTQQSTNLLMQTLLGSGQGRTHMR